MHKGRSSNNSTSPTKVYKQLVTDFGENPSQSDISEFIDQYLSEKNISIQNYIAKYQNDWNSIANEYCMKAEAIFEMSLTSDITIYLTINNRCPYNIKNKYFFVSFPLPSVRSTVMHELWHFFTWYGLGTDQEEKLGKEKYNDLKEALTVLLNIECSGMFPEGVQDTGYPQHKYVRERIIEIWNKEKDIFKLWKEIS